MCVKIFLLFHTHSGVIGYSTPPIFGTPLQNILGYMASPCQISLEYTASLNTPHRKFCTPSKIVRVRAAFCQKLNCSKKRLANSRASYMYSKKDLAHRVHNRESPCTSVSASWLVYNSNFKGGDLSRAHDNSL